MLTGKHVAGALAGVLVAVCAACSPKATDSPAGPATLHYPPPSTFSTTTAPPFEMSEYRLEMSCSLSDHTDSFAALSVNTGKEYPSAQIEILDLSTGKHSVAVSAPVTPDVERFDILGCRISDDWIAWEEVSPGETERPPEEVYWRLYIAPMPAIGSAVTSPALVDGARVADRTRPMFAFRGDELVWMTNDQQAIDGVSNGRKGVIRRRDAQGAVAPLLTMPKPISAFNVSERSLVMSYWLDRDGRREAVRVYVPDGKRTLIDVRPPGIGPLQHYPAYHGGDVAFRISPESKPESAALVVRRSDATVLNLGPDAMDPCFAGDYLFFDRDRSLAVASADASDTFEIVGMRLDDDTTFVVASSKPQGEGLWQTALAASGYRDTLVLYNDRSGWMNGRRLTMVRVYRGLEASATTNGDVR